jgi:hypothetical protein
MLIRLAAKKHFHHEGHRGTKEKVRENPRFLRVLRGEWLFAFACRRGNVTQSDKHGNTLRGNTHGKLQRLGSGRNRRANPAACGAQGF